MKRTTQQPAWLVPIVDTLRAICPDDLGRRPLYVLPRSMFGNEVADKLDGGERYSGRYGSALDLQLEPLIRSAGFWRGRGPCFLLHDEHLRETTHTESGFELAALGVAIHELAHAIGDDSPAATASTREQLPKAEQSVATLGMLVMAYSIPDTRLPAREPWTGHGLEFIRVVCHLVARARHHLGATFCADLVPYAGREYGLSNQRRYLNAMAGELADHPTGAIRPILKTKPPMQIVELFDDDVRRFHRRQKESAL